MAYGVVMTMWAPALSLSQFSRRLVPVSFPLLPKTHLRNESVELRRRKRVVAAAVEVARDAAATAIVVSGAYGLVSAFDYLTRYNVIEQVNVILPGSVIITIFFSLVVATLLSSESEPEVSSHLVRAPFSGIVASLQISTSSGARYWASIAPSLNSIRLLANGLSLSKDEGLVKSVSREGKAEELLRGPLYYVLVLILCTVFFWRESPVGMLSLAMMCGGDGIADIMGRRFGSKKLPYNPKKSWAGSISMFVLGFLVSISMLYYFVLLGYIRLDLAQSVPKVALVSFVATVVESLPITGIIDDNLSVPLVTMVAALLVFG